MPDVGGFLGLIMPQHDVVIARVIRLDPGIADVTESYSVPLLDLSMVASDLDDKDFIKLDHADERIHEDRVLKERLKAFGFHCISSPKIVPEIKKEHLVAFGFHWATSPKNYPEIKREDLEDLGFHFISFPKNVPEINEENLEALGFHFTSPPSNVVDIKKEHLEALCIHFMASPKNVPGIKQDCPELWRFHVAIYPKIVPGMTRFSPSLHALGTPRTSGNSIATEFIIYLDSGASCHVVHQAEMLINLRDPPPGLTQIKAADGALLTVSGFGDIQTKDFSIPDVCVVQGLNANLVSVGQLVSSRKISCSFNEDGCEVISYDDGSLVGSAVLRGDNQYVLSFLEVH